MLIRFKEGYVANKELMQLESINVLPFSPVIIFQQSSCLFNKDNTGARISGSVKIPGGSETDLLAAVATAGPVAVAVDASSKAFRVC